MSIKAIENIIIELTFEIDELAKSLEEKKNKLEEYKNLLIKKRQTKQKQNLAYILRKNNIEVSTKEKTVKIKKQVSNTDKNRINKLKFKIQ